LGGSHIWDGIVASIVDIVDHLTANFPTHTPIGGTGTDPNPGPPGPCQGCLKYVAADIITSVMDMYQLVNYANLVIIWPIFFAIGVILSGETVRIIIIGWNWIQSLIPGA
jgi:hypothetical protein